MKEQGQMLLIIDVQRGFITGTTAHIPGRVEALQSEFERVLVTRFVNRPDSPHRRFLGWERFAPDSDDVELAFAPRDDAYVMDKTTYSAATPDIIAGLQHAGVTEAHLCGIATETCVLKTAVDLFEAGIRPVVRAQACASHGGARCHDAGILLLKRFIGEDHII